MTSIKRRRGASLLDLLIAMSITTYALMASAGMIPVSFHSVQKGHNVLIASHLAQQEIEDATTTVANGGALANYTDYFGPTTWSRVQGGVTTNYPAAVGYGLTSIVNGVTQSQYVRPSDGMQYLYQASVQVTTPVGTPVGTNLNDVLVQVSWQEGSNIRYVTSETLLFGN